MLTHSQHKACQRQEISCCFLLVMLWMKWLTAACLLAVADDDIEQWRPPTAGVTSPTSSKLMAGMTGKLYCLHWCQEAFWGELHLIICCQAIIWSFLHNALTCSLQAVLIHDAGMWMSSERTTPSIGLRTICNITMPSHINPNTNKVWQCSKL